MGKAVKELKDTAEEVYSSKDIEMPGVAFLLDADNRSHFSPRLGRGG